MCTCCSLKPCVEWRSFWMLTLADSVTRRTFRYFSLANRKRKLLSQRCPLAVWWSIFTDTSTASKCPEPRELGWWKEKWQLHVQKAFSLSSGCATLHDGVQCKCWYVLGCSWLLFLSPALTDTESWCLQGVFHFDVTAKQCIFSYLLSVNSSFEYFFYFSLLNVP